MVMAMLVRNDAVREELAVRQYVSSKEFKVSTIEKHVHQNWPMLTGERMGKVKGHAAWS